MVVNCPVCGINVGGGLPNVPEHLRARHRGICYRGNEGNAFICHQEGCPRWFRFYRSWKRHIQRNHAPDCDVSGSSDSGTDNPSPSSSSSEHDGSDSDDPTNSEDSDEGSSSSSNGDDPPDNPHDSDEDTTSSEGSSSSDDGFVNGERRREAPLFVSNIIGQMRSDPLLTRKAVTRVTHHIDTVVEATLEPLVQELQQFLEAKDLENDPEALRLLRKFNYNSKFDGFRSKEGQIAAIKTNFKYNAPETIHLGARVDQRNIGRAQFGPRPVGENFQYVSILETLKLVRSKEEVMNHIRNLRPHDNGLISGYVDGNQYANHPLFSKYPDAFQLALYFDDVEIVNAEGSKCGIHTVACFYIRILNLPLYLQSQLVGIHILALATYDDIKSRNFRCVLQPFLDHMHILESDEGYRCAINGEIMTIRASLAAVMGDNKAVHEMLGFLGCGARHFCRLCMISRRELHEGNVVFGARRTLELHQEHLRLVGDNPEAERLCGVRQNACLHDLRHFHCTLNHVFDALHDGPEGIIAMEIRLVLKNFVCTNRYLTASALNRRIRAFNYGVSDATTKPSANFSELSLQSAETNHKLKQTASQTMCLLRTLPFLLDGFPIPVDDPHLYLLLLLQRIFEIIIAPKLNRSILPYLQDLITEHRRLYKQLFPNVNPINKHHYLEHYVQMIEEMGPPRCYWTMREEGEHRPLKRHIVSCGSYINPCKTAAQHGQIKEAMFWGTAGPSVGEKVQIVNGDEKSVLEIPELRDLFIAQGLQEEERVTETNHAIVLGTDYHVGQYVVLRPASAEERGIHIFGEIISIVFVNNTENVLLGVKEADTEGFADNLNGYSVTMPENAAIHICDPLQLPFHPPLAVWRDYSTPLNYLSLRHFIN